MHAADIDLVMVRIDSEGVLHRVIYETDVFTFRDTDQTILKARKTRRSGYCAKASQAVAPGLGDPSAPRLSVPAAQLTPLLSHPSSGLWAQHGPPEQDATPGRVPPPLGSLGGSRADAPPLYESDVKEPTLTPMVPEPDDNNGFDFRITISEAVVCRLLYTVLAALVMFSGGA